MTKKWLCEVLARSFFSPWFIYSHAQWTKQEVLHIFKPDCTNYDLRLVCTNMHQVSFYKYNNDMGDEVYHVAQKICRSSSCELVSFVLQDPGFEIWRGSSFVWGDKFLIFCKLHPIDFQPGLCHKPLTFALGNWENFLHIRSSQVFLVRDLWTP